MLKVAVAIATGSFSEFRYKKHCKTHRRFPLKITLAKDFILSSRKSGFKKLIFNSTVEVNSSAASVENTAPPQDESINAATTPP